MTWNLYGTDFGYTANSNNLYRLATQGKCPASMPVFTGTGLNDARTSALYDYVGTDGSNQTYTVIIDATGSPDTYKWQKGSGTFTTGVSITGSDQTLTDGIRIKFLATTGHTPNDQWVITVTNNYPFAAISAKGQTLFSVNNDSNTLITGHLTVTKSSTYNDSLRSKANITGKDSSYGDVIAKGKVVAGDSGKFPNTLITGVNTVGRDSAGNIVTPGYVRMTDIGAGLQIKEGANARMGTATLVGGTITVNNTSITANTRIFLTVSSAIGTQGFLSTTRIASTSFTITSTNILDVSIVNWMLIEPAP